MSSESSTPSVLRLDDGWRTPRLASRSEFVTVRDTRIHLRHWGNPDAPLLVLIHGWLDMSATYQFLVDACQGDWHFVAPDWAGHGQSGTRISYSMYDYMADLHELLHLLSPNEPVRVVAHSMGANVLSLYAGAKPERIKTLVNLEGYLHIPTDIPAPKRLANWLDSQSTPRRGSSYSDRAHLAQRLMKANPRLSAAKAAFLAEVFGVEKEDGRIGLAFDTRASYIMPITPQHQQTMELWRETTAPVLFVDGEESFVLNAFKCGREAELAERLQSVGAHRRLTLRESGHNMHHDQPQRLAQAIEAFQEECQQLRLGRTFSG